MLSTLDHLTAPPTYNSNHQFPKSPLHYEYRSFSFSILDRLFSKCITKFQTCTKTITVQLDQESHLVFPSYEVTFRGQLLRSTFVSPQSSPDISLLLHQSDSFTSLSIPFRFLHIHMFSSSP